MNEQENQIQPNIKRITNFKNVELLGKHFTTTFYEVTLVPEDIIASLDGDILYVCRKLNSNSEHYLKKYYQESALEENEQLPEMVSESDSEDGNSNTILENKEENEYYTQEDEGYLLQDEDDIQTVEDLKALEEWQDKKLEEERHERIWERFKRDGYLTESNFIDYYGNFNYIKLDEKYNQPINYYILKQDSDGESYYELWAKDKEDLWYRSIFDVNDFDNVIKGEWHKGKIHMEASFENFEHKFETNTQKRPKKKKTYTLIRYIAITSGMLKNYNDQHPRKDGNMFKWRVCFKHDYNNARRFNIKFKTPKEAKESAERMKQYKQNEHYNDSCQKSVDIIDNGGKVIKNKNNRSKGTSMETEEENW